MSDTNILDGQEPSQPWQYIDHLAATGDVVREQGFGLSKREYAAIHLRVPNSGQTWLDEMIEESLRNEFAGKALDSSMRGVMEMLANDPEEFSDASEMLEQAAEMSFESADAMLAARTGGAT